MIITRTPFRVSFFGGGTDYPVWYEENGGAVLSTTIDKYCYIFAREFPPFFPQKLRIVWSKIELADNPDGIEHPSVREVLKHLGLREGIEIHHNGDLPARSGLGSSSAFTVGLLHALHALKGEMMSKHDLAHEAIHVEQNLIGENVGSQDQVAAAFGGFNKITFASGKRIAVEPIVLPNGQLDELQDHLVLFFTGLSRNASEVAAEQMRNTPKKNAELKRMHEMVDEAIAILKKGTMAIDDFGRLLHETWQLKRSLSSSISTSAIDEIYDRARKNGAVGGKLLGAGSGGFMLLFVPPKDQERLKTALKGLLYVPFRFENAGTQIIYYGPKTIAR